MLSIRGAAPGSAQASAIVTVRSSGCADSRPYSARRNGWPLPSKCSQAFSPSRMTGSSASPPPAAANRRPASASRPTKSSAAASGVPARVDEPDPIRQHVVAKHARDGGASDPHGVGTIQDVPAARHVRTDPALNVSPSDLGQNLFVGRHPGKAGPGDERDHRIRHRPFRGPESDRPPSEQTLVAVCRPHELGCPRPPDAESAGAAAASRDASGDRRPCRTTAAESGGRTVTSAISICPRAAASRYSGITRFSSSSSTARSSALSSSVKSAALGTSRRTRSSPDEIERDRSRPASATPAGRAGRRSVNRAAAARRSSSSAYRGYTSIMRWRWAWKKLATMNAASASVSCSAGLRPSSRYRSRACRRRTLRAGRAATAPG